MAGYIDADKLYKRVKEKTNPYGKPTLDYESGVKVLDMIENAPTVDVVAVVRCKNCRHLERDDGLKSGKMCLIRGSSGWCNDNDFCSYGEPKTEDNHAHWDYWSGWAGNHDQRIEDATCSNCGYKHPTVRLDYVDGKFIKGYVPDKLAKECPKCGAKMVCQNPNEI